MACIVLTNCAQHQGDSDIEKEVYTPPPVIAINSSLETREVKLSDLMMVDQVVRLETTREAMLPASAGPILTKDYILTIDMNRLRQFDRSTGKFIRTLIRSGNGPEEYNTFMAYTIDNKRQLLYFYHLGDIKHIQVVDLKTGKHLQRIPLPPWGEGMPEYARIKFMALVNDTTFVCTLKLIGASPYSTFYLTTSGLRLGEYFSEMDLFGNGKVVLNKPESSLFSANDGVTFRAAAADTIYNFKDGVLTPRYVLDIQDKLTKERMEGNNVYVSAEGDSFLLMGGMRMKFRDIDDEMAIFSRGENIDERRDAFKTYFVDKRDFKTYLYKGVTIDYLGYWMEYPSFRTWGDEGSVMVTAFDLKENAKKILAEGTAPPEVLERLRKLDGEVSENDNPIILIGKLK